MNLTSLKMFIRRDDVKIIFIYTITGALLQVVSKKYLQNHPELLKNPPVNKRKFRLPKFLSSRGGALISISLSAISAVNIKFAGMVAVQFIAKNGMILGLAGGGLKVASTIPAGAISKYLRDALPQNLPHLDLANTRFVMIDGEKIYLNNCDQNLIYLFKMLSSEAVPYEEKEKIARSVLNKYLNLETMNGRVTFILCVVFILYVLSQQNPSSYYILLQNLLKAIKEGKISKKIGRCIVRRLKKKGIPIDPELLDVVSS